MVTLGSSVTNLMLEEIVNLANDGNIVQNAYVEFRTGPVPNSTLNLASGVLLATINLPNPAITGPVDGILTIQFSDIVAKVVASGSVLWFRYYNKNRIAIFDGTVTTIGGGGDIEIDVVDFVVGANITAINATMQFFCS